MLCGYVQIRVYKYVLKQYLHWNFDLQMCPMNGANGLGLVPELSEAQVTEASPEPWDKNLILSRQI